MTDKGYKLRHKLDIFRIVKHLLFCGLVLTCGLALTQSPVQFGKSELIVGKSTIDVEVATTPAQRQTGLMFRKSLRDNLGMWFIFDKPDSYCMWMKNTYVDLSVAFVNSAGYITNIEHMAAGTADRHCASQPVLYALEMPLGWFEKNGVEPGQHVVQNNKAR